MRRGGGGGQIRMELGERISTPLGGRGGWGGGAMDFCCLVWVALVVGLVAVRPISIGLMFRINHSKTLCKPE